MNGPEHAAKVVTDELARLMPATVARIEERLGLPEGAIPAPARYADHELIRIELDEWPAVFVVAQGVTDVTRVDVTAGELVYAVSYPVRVFVMARGDGWDDTDLIRKRLVLATREVLLGVQSTAAIDERTYRESYSDVAIDSDRNATIAGAYIEVVVTLHEVIADPPPLAHANTITAILHPAAD